MAKHTHKWFFVEEVKPSYISSSVLEEPGEGVGYWTRGYFRFVCMCGEEKRVNKK